MTGPQNQVGSVTHLLTLWDDVSAGGAVVGGLPQLLRASVCLYHPGLDRAGVGCGGGCGWDEPRIGLFDSGTWCTLRNSERWDRAPQSPTAPSHIAPGETAESSKGRLEGS